MLAIWPRAKFWAIDEENLYLPLLHYKVTQSPAMVAEWSKVLSQIQVEGMP